ncbi:methylosome subunit pICln [Trichonephila clavata]|uniref:Methylosome subunit pICln n=1 Tax=Trichonephila clavata TaxID=2740835 RepID=A0A8X6KHK6_TRICU|nr:methylosome subunit pICln [Trichonephila clavata]
MIVPLRNARGRDSILLKKERKMVVLRNFPAPTEGLHHVQPNTRVFFESECLGKGTLYISKSTLCWLSTSGQGFSLLYPSISIHAISRDVNNFPEPCIFMIVSDKIDEDPNELSSAINSMNVSSNDDEEEEESHKLLFVPDDLNMLQAVFTAIKECSALNPGPKDEYMDDDDGEDIFSNIDIQYGNPGLDPGDREDIFSNIDIQYGNPGLDSDEEDLEEDKNDEQFEDAES